MLFVSKYLWNKLLNKVKGRIYADCTDIIAPYWNVKPVKEKCIPRQNLFVWPTEDGIFVCTDRVPWICIDNIISNGKYYKEKYLFHDTSGQWYVWSLWITDPVAIETRTMKLYGGKSQNDTIYITKINDRFYVHLNYEICPTCDENYSFIKSYICYKRRSFIKNVMNCYDVFKFPLYGATCSGGSIWKEFKEKYRRFKSRLQN